MTYIKLQDSTGKQWTGDPSPVQPTPAELRSLDEMLQNWRTLNYLKLEVGGQSVYFNPAHVVSVMVIEE